MPIDDCLDQRPPPVRPMDLIRAKEASQAALVDLPHDIQGQDLHLRRHTRQTLLETFEVFQTQGRRPKA